MIIRKVDDIFVIKIIKREGIDFDIFNQEKIKEFFQNLLLEIKKKYILNGLLDIDVYIDEEYGMIIEINPIFSELDEIDMKISFHLDCIFLYEIEENELSSLHETYYYHDKYYGIYNNKVDSNIIYKTDAIFEKGIRIC